MEEKMQHRIVKFKYAEYTGICHFKNMLMISKKVHAQKQWQNMQKNAISSSAVPRTLRLLTSNMYVNVHIFFTAHIYIYMYA